CPLSAITAVRSLRSNGSAEGRDEAATSGAIATIKADAVRCVLTVLLLPSAKLRKLGRIDEDAPDRLARRRDSVRQRCVIVLEQGQHLEEQKIILLPE